MYSYENVPKIRSRERSSLLFSSLLFSSLLFSSLLLLISSCVETQDTFPEPQIYPEDGLVTLTRTLDVATRSGETASISAVFDVETETIISYSVSPGLLEDMQMTPAEFDDRLRHEMGPAYYLEPFNSAQSGPFSDCYAACADKKRGEGRGTCRFACWMDMFERIVTVLAEAVDVF
ncbi:MAG: hypothetical protein LBV18_02840 [Alistipes sp.]|jgi:hypothetical protein|nr:hypothetical protein [Alistipes sp.]